MAHSTEKYDQANTDFTDVLPHLILHLLGRFLSFTTIYSKILNTKNSVL